MWQLITGGIGAIVKPVAGYFTAKAQLSAARHAADLKFQQALGDRQAQLVSQGLSADAAWELESIRAAGWARNAELIVISIPLVLCFTRWHYIVADGFAALKETPPWFQWLAMLIYTANYGIRLWRRTQSDT